MKEIEFYKRKPTAPEESEVVKALRISLWISIAGWATYGLFAFAFADLGIIPSGVQSALVLIGSALIVIGGETNTIPTLVSALSKVGTGRFTVWDASATLASLVGSLCSALITFSTRQTELAGTPWREFAVVKGPLVLGIASTLDLYGAAAEKAFFKRDYEQAMEVYLEEKRVWQESHGVVTFRAEPSTEELIFDPDWSTMEKKEFEGHLKRLNGDRATLADPETLRKFIHSKKRNLPSRSTLRRFRELAGS